MHCFLFLEFIGTSELMVILVVALIVFGPRKLPELGRSLGQAMHQLRNASDDFKRTWETEARYESVAPVALAPAPEGEQDAAAAETSHAEVAGVPAQESEAPAGLSYAAQEAALVEA
ncbi:MAG TPA: twin-arginine translocase TatA/TatE family subunit [Pyrinomonadaceae bacterium]|jgi:TatA/E family protein of Tat protein translocase